MKGLCDWILVTINVNGGEEKNKPFPQMDEYSCRNLHHGVNQKHSLAGTIQPINNAAQTHLIFPLLINQTKYWRLRATRTHRRLDSLNCLSLSRSVCSPAPLVYDGASCAGRRRLKEKHCPIKSHLPSFFLTALRELKIRKFVSSQTAAFSAAALHANLLAAEPGASEKQRVQVFAVGRWERN